MGKSSINGGVSRAYLAMSDYQRVELGITLLMG
jgi:hypothetical protein